MTKEIEIGSRTCQLSGTAEASACVLCGIGGHSPDEAAKTTALVEQSCAGEDYLLVLFESGNWNCDFSPWPAPPVYGREAFPGGGAATLRWIQNEALPFLENSGWMKPEAKRYLAGYSLAGLFALWSYLESGRFDGAASCSGSLWFPGWMDYLYDRKNVCRGNVYLSLGNKEEQTRNAVMAAVGDHTRATYEFLKQQPGIRQIALEWNKGGHFANPEERLAKGIVQLLRWQKETPC